ncbi:hypothetical protein M409DRAFT_49300 [Zasmidium cellare ATCC 36951]|uniref:Uncharacterized protein n=1 Tax=Zasmidium cellare ATCC 36951 TaxID=1080233 RepID=A0A6A6D2W1_ZASCE|nr:uncharacterized protein M409DRAFT_49300 [Zasmidium cellare ATCC 36951]KAF2172768.1 hypothetical protein M409DRAFT_49300 [Zasmidium cellare ATCC 36951]
MVSCLPSRSTPSAPARTEEGRHSTRESFVANSHQTVTGYDRRVHDKRELRAAASAQLPPLPPGRHVVVGPDSLVICQGVINNSRAAVQCGVRARSRMLYTNELSLIFKTHRGPCPGELYQSAESVPRQAPSSASPYPNLAAPAQQAACSSPHALLSWEFSRRRPARSGSEKKGSHPRSSAKLNAPSPSSHAHRCKQQQHQQQGFGMSQILRAKEDLPVLQRLPSDLQLCRGVARKRRGRGMWSFFCVRTQNNAHCLAPRKIRQTAPDAADDEMRSETVSRGLT